MRLMCAVIGYFVNNASNVVGGNPSKARPKVMSKMNLTLINIRSVFLMNAVRLMAKRWMETSLHQASQSISTQKAATIMF